MKKSKRYIKKQNNKPLINKKVLAKVIRESNVGNLGLSKKNYGRNILKLFINIELIQVK